MNALQWLGRARALSWECEQIRGDYRRTRDRLENTTPSYSGQSSGTKDPHKLDALAAVAADLQDHERRLAQAREEIGEACDSLKSRVEARVLKLYYLNYLSWGGVAREIRRSVRQTMNIRADALAHITPIIEEVING